MRIGEALSAAIAALDARKTPRQGSITSGFPQLDQLLGGFLPGELVVVADRPNLGRRELLLSWLTNVAVDARVPCAYLSPGECVRSIALRLACMQVDVPAWRLLRGEKAVPDALRQQTDQLADVPAYIETAWFRSPEALSEDLLRLVSESGVRLVMLDGVEEFLPGMREPEWNTTAAEFLAEMREAAKHLDIVILAGMRLTLPRDERESFRPTWADFPDGPWAAAKAHAVICVHCEDYHHRGEPDYVPTETFELAVLKGAPFCPTCTLAQWDDAGRMTEIERS